MIRVSFFACILGARRLWSVAWRYLMMSTARKFSKQIQGSRGNEQYTGAIIALSLHEIKAMGEPGLTHVFPLVINHPCWLCATCMQLYVSIVSN